jgi:hypothetical protein
LPASARRDAPFMGRRWSSVYCATRLPRARASGLSPHAKSAGPSCAIGRGVAFAKSFEPTGQSFSRAAGLSLSPSLLRRPLRFPICKTSGATWQNAQGCYSSTSDALARPPRYSLLPESDPSRASRTRRTGVRLPVRAGLFHLFSPGVRDPRGASRFMARTQAHRSLSSLGRLGSRPCPAARGPQIAAVLHSLFSVIHG